MLIALSRPKKKKKKKKTVFFSNNGGWTGGGNEDEDFGDGDRRADVQDISYHLKSVKFLRS